jgi:ribosomal protein L18
LPRKALRVLTVNRTNLHIYASVISGDGGKVLAAASTAELEVRKALGAAGKGGNVAAAQIIGKRVAEKAKAAGVEKVAFDRQVLRTTAALKRWLMRHVKLACSSKQIGIQNG